MYRHIFVGAMLAVWPAIAVHASDKVYSKIVTDEGRHIGHTYRQVELNDDTKITTNFSQMLVREQDSRTRRYQTTTKFFTDITSGQINRIDRESGYSSYKNKIVFQRDGEMAHIVREAGKRKTEKHIPLPAHVAIDNGASQIKAWDFDRSPRLEFENLNLTAMNIETVIVEKAPRQNADTNILSLVRKTYDGNQLRTIHPFDLEKATGDVLTYELDLLRRKIIYQQADEKEATEGQKSFSVIRSSMIPSPHKISKSALKENIRYRFSYKDDIKFDLPVSGEQKFVTAGNFVVLDICDDCGEAQSLTREELSPYLSPSAWIESDDPDIAKRGARLNDKDMSDHQKMVQLGRFARKRINKVDFMGHYSASDTMKRRRGDCGEDAVLLAALGRAAGIPTRIAAGLTYSRAEYHGQSNVFLPHIWTQAYIDGRWKTYDISLGGFDASHIMTSVGHGDPRSISASIQLAKRLKWEDMVYVKPDEN